VWDFVDTGRYDHNFGSGRHAWWGGDVVNLTVDSNGMTGPCFRLVGGNRNVLTGLTSVSDTDVFFLVDDGRFYDGQYPIIHNFFSKQGKRGIWAKQNAPDPLFMHGLVYGGSRVGDVGVQLDGHNQTFFDVHTQFNDIGLLNNGRESTWWGGSWENKSSAPADKYRATVVMGPGVRWFKMDGTSFANKHSARTMFEIDPGAKRLRFRDLTGINETDVPAGFDRYFDIIPE
jgi:hypothetical protein